jgi:glyoxylase-like metal-dependent hydrolase (beta-lactamase superfamily II)
MKTVLKIVGIVVAVVIVAVFTLGAIFFAGLQKAGGGPALGAGFEPIQDGMSTVYLLDAGNGQLVLMDAGNNAKGTPILAALANRHATPDNVTAIFVTHAHPDHDATIALFPKATIYAMKREIPVANGSEAFRGPLLRLFAAHNPYPFQVGHPLDNGEKVTVGNLEFTAFDVPGHTSGSGAYLVSGVLFLGDAAQITSKQQIVGPNGLFSNDTTEGAASLKRLDAELQPHASEVKYLSTAHSGNVAGLQPLNDFAAK